MKEFADEDFKFDENGRKFFRRVGNIVGKEEIARYEQFLVFPQCFKKIQLFFGLVECAGSLALVVMNKFIEIRV